MIYGFRHQGGYEIPAWAEQLKFYYFVIRVEGRDKSKRRRYYRYIAKEKLRLAELNFDQQLIDVTCKYLSKLHPVCGKRMADVMKQQHSQLRLPF